MKCGRAFVVVVVVVGEIMFFYIYSEEIFYDFFPTPNKEY